MTTQTQPGSTPATDADAVDHHWLLTIQRPNGLVSCRTGITPISTGMTRAEAIKGICDTHFPGEKQIIVLFFPLEPNQL